MAAPMNVLPTRIALNFDCHSLENCWFVVDLSNYSVIGDIEKEVKRRHFKNAEENTRVVMRLNNFRLPTCESCNVLRDNDVVSVSLEALSVDQETCLPHAKPRKAKKRKHEELEMTEKLSETKVKKYEQKKKKRLKEAEPCNSESYYTNKIKCVTGTSPESLVTLKSDCSKELTKLSEDEKKTFHPFAGEISDRDEVNDDNAEDTAKKNKVNSAGTLNKNIQDDLDDSNVSSVSYDQVIDQTKRKRHRKRKRKGKANISLDPDGDLKERIVKSESAGYKGKEIGRDEIFYGSLPDKLETPKQYRHSYRNLQTFQVQPNKHKKFRSDSESDESQEHIEQYNFMSQSKETSATGRPETESSSFTVASVRPDPSYATKGHEDNLSAVDSLKVSNSSGHNGDLVYEDVAVSSSMTNRSQTLLTNNTSYISNTEWTEDLKNTSYNDSVKSNESAVELRPPLQRKTLSNGATLFTRQRSPHNTFREQTKEDQLNTSCTNVSTIFKNPGPTEFKVPVIPTIKPSSELETKAECLASSTTDSCSWMNKDFSTFPLVKTCPKLGDIIAYKVLEISMNLTPEVSSYKVAKVIKIGKGEMLELRYLQHSKTDDQNDKFHVQIETDDEILTNVEEDSEWVELHLSSLLETRILN